MDSYMFSDRLLKVTLNYYTYAEILTGTLMSYVAMLLKSGLLHVHPLTYIPSYIAS